MCLRAALYAKRHKAAVFISHGPRIAACAEQFLRKFNFRGKHLAFSFNFTELPHGMKRRMMARSFPTIDRFVVFSTMEKQLYHEALGIPLDKLNVNGGAIAIGHPFGMTGARITATLINSLQWHDKQFGVESMCVGGGMGMAMVIERLS